MFPQSPCVESLEPRRMFSATLLGHHRHHHLKAPAVKPSVQIVPAVVGTTPAGLTPAQVRRAYGFDNVTFNNGAIQGDGAGQTIAIVDAYDDNTVTSDLGVFSRTFGLPA